MAKLERLFASRFLKARKSNRLLSFLSITSIIGVMLGVAALITVVCVMDGFTKNLKSNFLGSNPHILITNINGRPLLNWEKYLSPIESVKGVKGITPVVFDQAMISSGNEISGVLVRGIEPEMEKTASTFSSTLVRGSIDDLFKNGEKVPGILLGQELLFAMGATVGDEVTLISPVMNKSAFGFIPKMKKFRIAGFFDTGIYEHNKTLVYINIKDAQDFFMKGNAISAVTVYADDPDKVEQIGKEISYNIKKDLNENIRVTNWLMLNGALFAALKLEQLAMFVILTLIIIVASFNIVSMLTVTVKDKRKEVAVLRAMGASEKLIKKIFIRQGLIIGGIGTILGDILALVIAFILKNFEIIKIPKEIYHTSTVPINLSLNIFIIVTFCSIVITYAASAIPAGIFAKSNPLEAIRNE